MKYLYIYYLKQKFTDFKINFLNSFPFTYNSVQLPFAIKCSINFLLGKFGHKNVCYKKN